MQSDAKPASGEILTDEAIAYLVSYVPATATAPTSPDPEGPEESVRSILLSQFAALRAALTTATRALEKIADRHIPTYSTNFEWMREIANDHRRRAAAALAQIEGGKK